MRYWLLVILWSVLVGAPASETLAKDVESQESTESQGGFSDEVTVTARRREEDLQDVPFSVVAPSEETLRDRGAETIEDVAANVSGFTVQNLGPGQSQLAIRGISAGQIVREQPGVKEQVGVYLDESPVSLSLFTPDLDLFDMERVEVLRGPQGTLFGGGSQSGTVRYISKQPQLGRTDSVIELGTKVVEDGDFGGSAKFAGNVPLGERAAMRIAAYFDSIPGYIDAVQPNLEVRENVNGGERVGARWAFLLKPGETVALTPRIVYQETNLDGWNRIDAYNILANPYTTSRPPVTLGERQQFIQLEEPFHDTFVLADLETEIDLGGVDLVSNTSFVKRDIEVVRDATALTASITGGSLGLSESVYTLDSPLVDTTAAQALTEEIRLEGEWDRFAGVVGAFYSTRKRDYGQSLTVNGFERETGIPTAGLRAARDEIYFSDISYELDQLALFTEATYSVSDRFDLTAGLRWYDYEEDRTQLFDGILGNEETGTALATNGGSTSADGVAPRVIASFEATESTRLNAQISKGFRLGGINDSLHVPLCTPEDLETFGGRETFRDEEAWSYEIGSKSRFGRGTGSLNLAVFYMDVTDLQVTVTAGSCTTRIIYNVPKARSVGIELELAARPIPSVDVSLSASYARSEIRSTLTSTDASGDITVVSGIEKGNRLPSVPELQVALAMSYRWNIRDKWSGYLTGTYQHVGSRYTRVQDQAPGFGTVDLEAFAPNTIGGPLTNSSFVFDPLLPAYDIVNLKVGVLHGPLDLALGIENVTDERAFLALDQERGTLARVGYLTNRPRTFSLVGRINF